MALTAAGFDDGRWPRGPLTARDYRCECCGGIYHDPRPNNGDVEANAEAAKIYGRPIPEDEKATMCEGCWVGFEAWRKAFS